MTQQTAFPGDAFPPFPFPVLPDDIVSHELQPSESYNFPSVQTAPAVPDMATARALLEPFRATALQTEQAASEIDVHDDASMSAATFLAGNAKKSFKKIETARKTYLAPLSEHTKQVNGLAKEITAPLEHAEMILKKKMTAHAAAQELSRRKAEEAARREAAEQQRKLNEEAAAAGVEAPIIPEVLSPETKQQPVRTEGGTSYTQSRWTFKLDALSSVPLEFLMLDERKVRDAIRGGVRNIPGISITEEKTIAIRS